MESPKGRKEIFNNFSLSDSLKFAALPAVLYAIQNLLTQYGYDKIDGMSFNVLNQTKVVIGSSYFLY
jgi:hypothetical protein